MGMIKKYNNVSEQWETILVGKEGYSGISGYSGYSGLGSDSTKLAGINAQTGTTYTLVLADAGKRVRCTNADPITVTVPQNSSVAYVTGTYIEIEQGGAGVVTLDEDTNVTLNSAKKTWGQYSTVRITKVDTNTWTVDGGSE